MLADVPLPASRLSIIPWRFTARFSASRIAGSPVTGLPVGSVIARRSAELWSSTRRPSAVAKPAASLGGSSAPSNSPFCIRCALVLSSGTNTTVSFLIRGAPSRCAGFASRTILSPLVHSVSLYGPVPTGAVFTGLAASGPPAASASEGRMPSTSRSGNGA